MKSNKLPTLKFLSLQAHHPLYKRCLSHVMIILFSYVCIRKKGERLDWMYAAAAGQVDHELYLLGKTVDKAVDPMAQDNEEVGLIKPFNS